jgi:hypothetical protein
MNSPRPSPLRFAENVTLTPSIEVHGNSCALIFIRGWNTQGYGKCVSFGFLDACTNVLMILMLAPSVRIATAKAGTFWETESPCLSASVP